MEVPFFANSQDNTHCFQAALAMILKAFWPEREFTWEELDEISGKKGDLWTWAFVAGVWMQRQGFEVVNIDPFDNQRFIDEGEGYLNEVFGKEVAKIQITHSDIPSEQRYAAEFIRAVKVDQRIPTIDDIRRLLDEGYLITCNVNSKALAGKEGYSGHAIVPLALDDHSITFHDPGLPPRPSARADIRLFEKAWGSPNEGAKNILAFRVLK